MSVRVKTGRVRAVAQSPSLRTVVNRGYIHADQDRGQPIATVHDTATSSRVYIPFSYIKAGSVPTDTPPEFSGFSPLRMDTDTGSIYFFNNGAWAPLAPTVMRCTSGERIRPTLVDNGDGTYSIDWEVF